MALVAFLRGVNVGGHRSFRPSVLARELGHLDVVSIGAAGNFVIRKAITPARLREELRRRIPFSAEIAICKDRELFDLVATDRFAGQRARPDVIRFVSVLARRARATPVLPLTLPARGPWMLEVLGADGRFVYGLHRRQMKAIGFLGELDRLFGVPVTTRQWSTMNAIAKVLRDAAVRTR
jgi:uncharacterized protein (DUF1697 family)